MVGRSLGFDSLHFDTDEVSNTRLETYARVLEIPAPKPKKSITYLK